MFNSTPAFGTQQPLFGQNNNAFTPKPFGTPTTTFGTQAQQPSVFGQNNNAFTPKPFGTPATTFGTQAAGSMFSGTSTGNFGGGTQAFSSPAFGNTTSAPVSSFGSTTPAFGTSSFAGTSIFAQQPASTFGVNASTPAFGTPTTTPAFGSQPNTVFGSQQNTGFGSQQNAGFGSQQNAGFGIGLGGGSGNQGFGVTNAASTTAPFGSQLFNSGASPGLFAQTNSAFAPSTPAAPFGSQSSSFNMQTTAPSTFGTPGTFGQPGFGQQQRGGSRAVAYAPTNSTNSDEVNIKFQSISCMPVYLEKSHDELRWEDYQLGDKGGPITQPNPFTSTATNPNPFSIGLQKTTTFTGFNTSGTAGSTLSNPFATGTPLTSTNVFQQPSTTPAFTPYTFGTSPSTTPSTAPSPFSSTPAATNPNPFGVQQPNNAPFNSTPTTPNPNPFSFQQPNNAPFNSTSTTPNPNPFSFQQPNNAPFNSTPATPNPNPFGVQQPNGMGQFSSSPFAPVSTTCAPLTNTVGTQSSGLWNNSTPSLLSNTAGAQNSGFVNNLTPSQPSNTFGTQTPGFVSPFNTTPSTPSWSPFGGQTNPSQQTQPAFSNVSTSIGVAPSVFTPNTFGQNTFAQPSNANQSNTVATQPSGVAMNPFGTLPAMPQLSIGYARAAPTIQYGISRMPVVENAAPVRVSPLLMTSRHLSQNRIRLPARRSANNNSARVPFFSDDEEAPSTPKADALFIPRENPRALVIRPLEHWSSRVSAQKSKDINNTPLNENGKVSEKDSGSSLNGSINHEKHKSDPLSAENGHDKERTNTETDIDALMPKLRCSDYYTEPQIKELAAKERAEPGFCSKVKDFVVGRHGFGSIKIAGETDVRKLDLDSLVQFNNREVIVYLDDSKKPPVGQGLNKAAVVTLLNIKCFDKKTGQQCIEGVRVEKYKEMLMKKTVDQGAEFVSYDPIKGEWKFKVDHF